jgi:hypothetical protein
MAAKRYPWDQILAFWIALARVANVSQTCPEPIAILTHNGTS